MTPSYIRVRAVVWAYGRGQTDRQTDTQTRVTTIHFASSTTHAKCKNIITQSNHKQLKPGFDNLVWHPACKMDQAYSYSPAVHMAWSCRNNITNTVTLNSQYILQKTCATCLNQKTQQMVKCGSGGEAFALGGTFRRAILFCLWDTASYLSKVANLVSIPRAFDPSGMSPRPLASDNMQHCLQDDMPFL